MPMPREFRAFRTEAEFIARFLHPLLRKLGFSVVLDYHGQEEYGKDLIFAELDRFGLIRYHAMQVRMSATIGLKAMMALVETARMAFANPFVHPQTGQPEAIGGFYIAVVGVFTPIARRHFFASLIPQQCQNVFLLDGPSLLQLDRWTSLGRAETVQSRIVGLLNELQLNQSIYDRIREPLRNVLDGKAVLPPADRLLTLCVGLYNAEPFIVHQMSLTREYVRVATRLNALLGMLVAVRDASTRYGLAEQAWEELCLLRPMTRHIHDQLERFVEQLGPVAAPENDPPQTTEKPSRRKA